MSRYIDAEKLIEKVNNRSTHLLNEWDTLGVLAVIDETPTADVEEVRPEHDGKNKKIYVVTVGYYSDYRILAVFESADKAAAYIDSRTWKHEYYDDGDDPRIEEYEVYDDRIEAVNSKAVYLYWYGIIPKPEFDKEEVCFELTSQKTANRYINSVRGMLDGFIYCALPKPNFEKACKILADEYYERKARRAGVCDDFRR